MRKTVVMFLSVLAAMTLAGSAAYCVDNQTVDVVMSIQTLEVTAVKVYDPVSTLPGASKVVNGRAVFTNAGNGTEDFSVRIASTAGSWSPFSGTSAVPLNQYRLRVIWAAFYASTMSLTTADFNDNDILTTSNQPSSQTVFFKDASDPSRVGTPGNNGGFSVPITGLGDPQRHLFFRFDAGAAGTTGTSTAYVNVTATATP